MQNEPLISVIVPVYKVEPYLDRCVRIILWMQQIFTEKSALRIN